MIKDKGDWIELDIIIEKYKKHKAFVKDSEGKKILSESGKPLRAYTEKYNGFIVILTNFLKDGLTFHGAVSNINNKVLKTRATIFDKFSSKFYVVNHRPEDIAKILISRSKIGFKLGK